MADIILFEIGVDHLIIMAKWLFLKSSRYSITALMHLLDRTNKYTIVLLQVNTPWAPYLFHYTLSQEVGAHDHYNT